jgi:hypothetical protein
MKSYFFRKIIFFKEKSFFLRKIIFFQKFKIILFIYLYNLNRKQKK